jgi:uncharacterized membrane protein
VTPITDAAPLPRRLALLDTVILGILLTITLLLAATLPQSSHMLRLTMDAPSSIFRFAGLYPVERFAVSSQVYRWTSGQSKFSFPVPGNHTILQIDLLGHPGEQTPIRLTLGSLDSLIMVPPSLRRYSVLLSPAPRERVSLAIEAPTVTIARRDLGVAVSDVVLVSHTPHMPALVVIALVMAMIGSYSLAVQAGAPRWMVAGGVLGLALFTLLWHSQWGWQYGLTGPPLLLLSSLSLAGVVLECGWLQPAWARAGRPRWRRAWPVVVLLAAGLGAGLPWIAGSEWLPAPALAGLTLLVVSVYLLLRHADWPLLWASAMTLLAGAAGLAWVLSGALDSWLPGLVLLLLGCATLILALRQSSYVAWLRQDWASIAAILLTTIALCGVAFHILLWQTPLNNGDIYYIWLDVTRIMSGENPYMRILAGNMQQNNKYTTYFPLFYYLGALTHLGGFRTFDQWFAFWRVIFLICNGGIGILLFTTLYRAKLLTLAVLAAIFWFFNRWTIYVSVIGQVDFVAIFFFVLSLLLFDKKIWWSLVALSISLALKQVAILVVPFYLILIWQQSRSLRITLLAGAVIGSVTAITSLPFLLWNAEGFVKSILFSTTRESTSYLKTFTADEYLQRLFPHFGGALTRLPGLTLMLLAYLYTLRYQPGVYTCAFLALSIFVNFNPVLLNQYMAWLIPCVALVISDTAQFVKQKHSFGKSYNINI